MSTQAVVDGKGAAVLEDNVAKFTKRAPLFEPEHFQRHVADEPCRQRPSEIGKVRLGQLVIERLVSDRRAKEGFDHGAGHSLLLLYDAKTSHGKNINNFNSLSHDPSIASTSFF